MTENDVKSPQPAAASPERQPGDQASGPGDRSPWESEAGLEAFAGLAADVERLEAEKADLTDRLVRLAADMENLRRRTERDVNDARKYAVAKFAADMLVVGDNLRRALESVPQDRQSADDTMKVLAEGVEMTGREMDRLLEKNGISRIAAKGERFDPNRHQAMFEVPDPSVPAGTVVQVVQEGYQIGDRVLRAALVGVAKGGMAAPTAPEAPSNDNG